ncbi:MAG: tol-pal system YbgF family protein [Sandaracinaceae bacterium]
MRSPLLVAAAVLFATMSFGAMLTVALPGTAFAQDTGPSATDDAEARALFLAGQQAFSAAHFDRALEYFQRAFELSDRPELLFNIANCHDRLHQNQEAFNAFNLYLERVGDAPNAPFARTRIAALEQAIAEDAAAAPAESAERPTTVSASPRSSTAATDPGATEGGGGLSGAGLALTVVGGAIVLGGVGTAFWYLDRENAVEQCGGTCMNRTDLEGERDSALITMSALLAGGALLATIGIVVIAVDSGGDGESASLQCVPGLSGVSCAGRF